MSDMRLRQLERRWAETGASDPQSVRTPEEKKARKRAATTLERVHREEKMAPETET